MGALDGAVAVVTGASRGIGKGAALELGSEGATVYVTGRSVEPGRNPLPGTVGETAREVDAEGGAGVAVACDQRDDAQVQALFERVEKEQGRLDVLVNSAFHDPGISAGKKFWETPISWYDDMNDVGTRSAYVAAWHAVRLMLPAGKGLIVNVSSMGGERYYQHVAYGMGKGALDRLTRDAGYELREHGIAVVSVWPYFVKTEGLLDLVARGADFPTEDAESQRFTGRGILHLALDPNVMERSRKAWTALELAQAYGFTDVDGKLPGTGPPPRWRK